MLVEFSVENFLSIKDKQTFSFLATSRKEKNQNTFESLPERRRNTFLKSSVIYGPNASGKSNFITAFNQLQKIVLTSHRHQVGDTFPMIPFKLDETSPNQPPCFEIIFLKDDTKYAYGVRVDNAKVHDEFLYCWKDGKKRVVFERSNTNGFKFSFSSGSPKEKVREEIYLERILDNTLLLSVATKLKNKEATNAFEWFRKNLRITSSSYSSSYTSSRLLKNKAFKDRLTKYLSVADLDIQDVQVSERVIPTLDLDEELDILIERHAQHEIEAKTIHHFMNSSQERVDVAFDLDWESEGTLKYYSLLGPIDDVLENGYVLVIDELDVHLHPILIRKLIELFHSPETNQRNAQLLFSTHNTSLLDQELFRRDQVWFMEKNRETKGSELFSLSEIKNVRQDLRLEKSYLQGRFGAIPLLEEWS